MYALSSAGDAVLAETSGHPIWGIGTGILRDGPRVHEPDQWTGENLHGVTLELVREHLRRGLNK